MKTRGNFRSVARSLALVVGGFLLFSGCAATDQLVMTGSRRLNSCDGKEPHPVGVRIYYLTATDRFSKADFASLWENDVEVLGEDRVKVTEVTVVPQKQAEVKLARPKGATALGIVANFCRPGEGCWRKVIPFEGRDGKLLIHLDEGCLSLD